LYERARVFVVPTRFAAGMPLKAHEAAAFGVPMVVSPVIARQMRWSHGSDYFAADNLDEMADFCVRLFGDQQLWECFRVHSLSRVKAELSPAVFREALFLILKQITVTHYTENGPPTHDKLGSIDSPSEVV
jgi:glycosyltransferase involved in cell wall biosynthesis